MREESVQFPIGLPDVIKVHNVWMINQLHNDDLPLDPQQHLLALGSGFRDGHARGEDRLLRYDLDRCVLACFRVFGELDPACNVKREKEWSSERGFSFGERWEKERRVEKELDGREAGRGRKSDASNPNTRLS